MQFSVLFLYILKAFSYFQLVCFEITIDRKDGAKLS